jgi:hypothetical protein
MPVGRERHRRCPNHVESKDRKGTFGGNKDRNQRPAVPRINPPFVLPRQEGKATVDEKRPTPGGRNREGLRTDHVDSGPIPRPNQCPAAATGQNHRTSLLPRQQKPTTSAAAATGAKSPVAENRSDARGPKTRSKRPGYVQNAVSAAPDTWKLPYPSPGNQPRLRGPKPVPRPGAENTRDLARIRRKCLIRPPDYVENDVSAAREPVTAPVAEYPSHARGPKTRSKRPGYGENALSAAPDTWKMPYPPPGNQPRLRGPKTRPTPGGRTREGLGPDTEKMPYPSTPDTWLLPRQQKPPDSAAAAAGQKLWRSPGPMYCRGPGGGYAPQVYWGVKEGSQPMSCRGSKKPPISAAAATRKNCGALRVQCTAGVLEGAVALGYIGG